MNKTIITNPFNLKFEPFNNYGEPIKGMSWCKISYDQEKGQGSYILKMEPMAKSLPHEHVNYEEFYMLDGELADDDGKIFKKGEFITFEPGTRHSSTSKNGCLILVFMRSRNKVI